MIAANPSSQTNTRSSPAQGGFSAQVSEGVRDPAAWIRTFAYRVDDFFVQGVLDGSHPVPRRRALREDDVRRGLAGQGPSVSILFVGADNTSKVAAIDADDEQDGWATVLEVASVLRKHEIQCAVERSRRGGHLWIAFDDALPAFVIRHALQVAIELAGHSSSNPKIEIRPATDEKRSPYGGGILRGPMMPHPETGLSFPLLDPMTEGPLEKMPIVERDSAIWLAAIWQAPPDEPGPDGKPVGKPYHGPSKVATYNDRMRIWDVLELYFPGSLRGRFARETRCPFHDDRRASLSIYANGTKVKCHAAGCILADRGPQTAYGFALLCKEVGP